MGQQALRKGIGTALTIPELKVKLINIYYVKNYCHTN